MKSSADSHQNPDYQPLLPKKIPWDWETDLCLPYTTNPFPPQARPTEVQPLQKTAVKPLYERERSFPWFQGCVRCFEIPSH